MRWLIFMISGSKEQLQQELEYILLKPDCHSWWISKMPSGREDNLEEWYAIKLCFKLARNVAFRPGQYTSPQLHPCHKLFDQDWHHDSSSPSLLSRPCSLWLLVIPLAQRLSLSDNWGYERDCDEDHWHAHTRGLPWGLPEVVGTVQQVHFNQRRLFRRGLEFHVCTINKRVHTK